MKIDDNNCYVVLAKDTDGNAIPLRIDPVTGRLLIEIHYVAEAERTVNPTEMDENNEATSLVLGDDDVIYPLQIDNRNGYLLINIE